MSQATLNNPTSPVTPVSPVGYAGRRTPHPRQRVNVRLIVFMAAVAFPFLGVFYLFLKPLLNGGITQHAGYAEVELKAMGNFAFDPKNGTDSDIPARWRALDGKRVVLKGFMWAPRSAGPTGAEFEFVYNVAKCCFGGPPLVQERVFGHTRGSETVRIFDQYQFVELTGVLHVHVVRDETGAIHSVFDLDVEKAEPITG